VNENWTAVQSQMWGIRKGGSSCRIAKISSVEELVLENNLWLVRFCGDAHLCTHHPS